MARKNSTIAAAGIRIQAWSESRAMPKKAPSGRAMTMERAAAFRVFCSPGQRYVLQASPWTKGFHFSQASWSLSLRLVITHHNRAAKATRNSAE